MSIISKEDVDSYLAELKQDDVLTAEMMVENYTTGDDMLLTVEKLSSARVKMDSYVNGVKQKVASEFPSITFEADRNVEIAGKEFVRVAYTTAVQGMYIKQVMYLYKVEERMVAITVTAVSENAEAEFIACFKAK